MGFLRGYWGLILVLLLSIFLILPLFQSGFFSMHDDTQVVRVYEMGKVLKDGMFPVRWSQDLGYGYGYPLFNFYSPLPYYFGGLLNLLGFDALMSTKVMMAVGILLAGLFMYFLAREFWGEPGGIVAGLFYAFAPYHALDIYVRGAVGEFWAYAFLPLMALGFYKIYENSKFPTSSRFRGASKIQNWRWIVIGSLGFVGVILSHNLTALMVTPILAIATLLHGYMAYRQKKLVANSYWLVAIFFALGLSAFYWLPALLEMGYTNVLSQIGGGADFKDHFVCVQQLWNSPWGFGGSIPGCLDGMSFKVGKLHILAVFISILILILPRLNHFKHHSNDVNHYSGKFLVIFLAIFGFLVSVFMMLEISKPVWETIWPLIFVQYPWRFLILVSFSSSFLAGASVWFLQRFNTVLYLSGGLILIVLLFYPNLKLFQPQTIFPRTADFYTNEENIKWTTSKISDEYLPRDFLKPENEKDILKSRITDGKIIIDKTQELLFSVDNKEEKKVLVGIAPFPAWHAFIDGSPVDIDSKNNGIGILVPKGRHEVELLFVSSAIERLANLISLISLLALLGGILLRHAKSR